MNPLTTAPIIVSLLALGMALSFLVADRRSPISRVLSGFLAAVGTSIAVNVLIALPMHQRGIFPPWDGVFTIPETLAFILAAEWLLRVRRTIPAGNLDTRGADRLLRVAQVLATLYGLMALLFPHVHFHQFSNVFRDTEDTIRPGFWLFAVPLSLALLLMIVSGLFMLRRRPDRAEAMRGVAFLIASPVMASGILLPVALAPVATAIGLLIFLVGAVQYHVTQGRRAQFMARFLAPQVAEMVSRRGLKSATDVQTLEISIVSCDLRGFTAFSAATPSKKVITILREYYDAVGKAAGEFGGTIKDQAGDGVLILVGAPLAFPDHAERAIKLARLIRERAQAVLKRWSDGELHLGIGIGVATGYVTVGVIGAASRLEYTAVGPPVNLASRLCSEAPDGEILIDARTAELAVPNAFLLSEGDALKLKGFAEPVHTFRLGSA